MNAQQKKDRAENEKVLARNFPSANAKRLQADLWVLGQQCHKNAEHLCNTEGYVDRRDYLRQRLAEISAKHGVDIDADVTGDPRGYCLKVHMPDGSHNTWGGKEAGWGF